MLFVGDDWADDHHVVEVVGEDGRRLVVQTATGRSGRNRGVARADRPIRSAHRAELDTATAAARVKIGIETDRGPWVAALIAAGYEVFAINPMSVSRYRDRHSTSGAQSDAGDAHVLAEIVRLDRAHRRATASDSTLSQAMKLLARSHQSLIWERSRHVLRLRSTLREYFPAALAAFEDLDSRESLELLAAAPDPDRAARLSKAKIAAALRRAHRRKVAERTEVIYSTLRAAALRQPVAIQSAFAVIATSEVRVITALDRRDRCAWARWWLSILAATGTLTSTPANPDSA